MLTALAGAVVLAVLSTFYDFVWAHFEVRHKAINGLVHGMTLLSVAGLVLAWPRAAAGGWPGGWRHCGAWWRPPRSTRSTRCWAICGAIVAAWMLLWLLFGGLEAWLRHAPVGTGSVLVRRR